MNWDPALSEIECPLSADCIWCACKCSECRFPALYWPWHVGQRTAAYGTTSKAGECPNWRRKADT